MALDATKVYQAPAQILFGTAGSEIDLGSSQGGVTVTVTGNVADVLIDQFGAAVQVAIDQGDTVEVATKLLQVDVNVLVAAFPTVVKNTANTVFWLRAPVGSDALVESKSLLLKQISNGVPTTDKMRWIRFFKARRTGNVVIPFSNTDAHGYTVTWRVIPTQRTELGTTAQYLGVIGDEAAV